MDSFLSRLKRKRVEGVFNPWFDQDPHHDFEAASPEIRLENLICYLKERAPAQYLLVAEALGYQGGHFAGIAMTSERILLGHMAHKGIYPHHVIRSITPRRTSKSSIKTAGFSEPTATVVWGKLIELGLDTKNFVLWNAFPWHPYKPDQGFLSNRTPSESELKQGQKVLEGLLQSMSFEHIIAVGDKAHAQLTDLGVKEEKVRHPANGGAGLFRAQ